MCSKSSKKLVDESGLNGKPDSTRPTTSNLAVQQIEIPTASNHELEPTHQLIDPKENTEQLETAVTLIPACNERTVAYVTSNKIFFPLEDDDREHVRVMIRGRERVAVLIQGLK